MTLFCDIALLAVMQEIIAGIESGEIRGVTKMSILRIATACFVSVVACTFLSSLPTASSQTLVLERRIGEPVKDRTLAMKGRIDHASWLDEDTIIYWSYDGTLKCHDLEEKKDLWTVKDLKKVSCWSVSRKKRLLAIVFDTGEIKLSSKNIRIIDCMNGKTVFETDVDKLNKLLKTNLFILPNQVALTSDDGRLVVCGFNQKYGRYGFVLDEKYTKAESTFDIDPFPHPVVVASNGNWIAMATGNQDIAIRNIESNNDIYFSGDPKKRKSESNLGIVIDAPFISQVDFDGKSKVAYAIDNSWGKGRINVLDLKTKEERTFSSRNGHLVWDVDFKTARMILTGTSKNLSLLSLEGEELAQIDNATHQRNLSVEFSPSGRHVLVGSWDNTVSVFKIRK